MGFKLLNSLFLSLVASLGHTQPVDTALASHGPCDLIGVWQRDHSIVGSGPGQNFQFKEDSTFVLDLGTISDDARMLVQLKGHFRLDADELFFTILSRVVREGEIDISDAGIDLNLFSIRGAVEKEQMEVDPKEIADPCYIQFISCKKMKLNNEIYFKVD
ncbi:MAG: hypothetical protein ABIQ75_10820 [Flavobacteriales bacterium]